MIASLVALVAQRVKIPYTVPLWVGLFITYQADLKFELAPELVMVLLILSLGFEAAFHLQLRQLKDNLVAGPQGSC